MQRCAAVGRLRALLHVARARNGSTQQAQPEPQRTESKFSQPDWVSQALLLHVASTSNCNTQQPASSQVAFAACNRLLHGHGLGGIAREVVSHLLEDVAEDASRLERAQEIAEREFAECFWRLVTAPG